MASKYIGVKPTGLNYWLWFMADRVTEDAGMFRASNGWGPEGDLIASIEVPIDQIDGRVESDTLLNDS